jgi:hypothetical protein
MGLMLFAGAVNIVSDGLVLAAGTQPEWMLSSMMLMMNIVMYQQLRRSQALAAIHGVDHIHSPQPRAGRAVLAVAALVLGAGVAACAYRYSAQADLQVAIRPLYLAQTCILGLIAMFNVFRKPPV